MDGELFYIQTRGYCGDCLVWWRVDGHGYTSNLDEAWKVDKAKAAEICRSRPREDFARSVTEADAAAHRHVNAESIQKWKIGDNRYR